MGLGMAGLASAHVYFGQGAHGYGFQQQQLLPLPGVRPPGVAPNYIMPYHHQLLPPSLRLVGNPQQVHYYIYKFIDSFGSLYS